MLLIFDIDGTICNTKLIGDNCFIKTFETMYNCQLVNIEWESFTNVTDSGLYNDLFFQYNKKLPNNAEKTKFETLYKSNLMKAFSKNTPYEVEGAMQFISFCKNKNICIAIATGNWRSIAKLKMNSCNIDFEKTPLSTSDDALHREDIIKLVIQQSLHVYNKPKFEKVIYFGDGLWDYECAKKLKIHFIGIDIDDNKKLAKNEVSNFYQNFNDYQLIFQQLNYLQ